MIKNFEKCVAINPKCTLEEWLECIKVWIAGYSKDAIMYTDSVEETYLFIEKSDEHI